MSLLKEFLTVSASALILTSSFTELPTAAPNDNRAPAGALIDRTLVVALETRQAIWHPDGDSLPGREVAAFAEEGKTPLVPGPLIRVPVGTNVEMSVRNTDLADTLLLVVPARMRGASARDTMIVPPRERRTFRFTAIQPGNFHYRGLIRDPLTRILQMHGLLGGAIIVDSTHNAPADRVFVMMWSVDSLAPIGSPNFFNLTPVQTEQPHFARSIFSINGRNWPHTEPLSATVGDTLRWRVVNLSDDVHPMHLHGFFFRVEEYWGPSPSADGQEVRGRMAVTERLPPFSGMTMTWVPERAGNWLFHCHFAVHVLPLSLVSAGPSRFFSPPQNAPGGVHDAHGNHAAEAMSGLVMGIRVRARSEEAAPDPARGARRLRLVAVQDSGFPDDAPSMRFRLEEGSGNSISETSRAASPTIQLRRGEPVSILVANTMREETAVHWHGMELESYYDGVPGFAGSGSRVAPIIAPGDSFEVRFTPPRSGTFMYHSHLNEPRQHRAGLLGALIVNDSVPLRDEVLVLLKAPRGSINGLEINGQTNPDTIVLRAKQPARVRLMSLTYVSPGATVWLTARPDSVGPNSPDSMVVQWKPVAKDGAELPQGQQIPRLARQLVSMGETYDFEFTPPGPGNYRVEVRGGAPTGRLQARIPLRVE